MKVLTVVLQRALRQVRLLRVGPLPVLQQAQAHQVGPIPVREIPLVTGLHILLELHTNLVQVPQKTFLSAMGHRVVQAIPKIAEPATVKQLERALAIPHRAAILLPRHKARLRSRSHFRSVCMTKLTSRFQMGSLFISPPQSQAFSPKDGLRYLVKQSTGNTGSGSTRSLRFTSPLSNLRFFPT